MNQGESALEWRESGLEWRESALEWYGVCLFEHRNAVLLMVVTKYEGARDFLPLEYVRVVAYFSELHH